MDNPQEVFKYYLTLDHEQEGQRNERSLHNYAIVFFNSQRLRIRLLTLIDIIVFYIKKTIIGRLYTKPYITLKRCGIKRTRNEDNIRKRNVTMSSIPGKVTVDAHAGCPKDTVGLHPY